MRPATSRFKGRSRKTLGYGLNDSPARLAAWIVEKCHAWCDCQGDVESNFTKDELLTNIMLYWVTETATSAARLYYESRWQAWAGSSRAVRAAKPSSTRQTRGMIRETHRQKKA